MGKIVFLRDTSAVYPDRLISNGRRIINIDNNNNNDAEYIASKAGSR